MGEWVVWVYKPILVLSFSSSLTKIKCEQWTKVKGLMSVFPFPVCVYAVIHYYKVRVKQIKALFVNLSICELDGI